MKIRDELGLSFDDVLLVPQQGRIRKRENADIFSRYVGPYSLNVPIISAPMASVTEGKMMVAMCTAGATGVLHRFCSIDSQLVEYEYSNNQAALHSSSIFSAAIGINEGFERSSALIDEGCGILVLDVAHADHITVIEYIRDFREHYFGQEVYLIAGNVATYAGAKRLAEAGADSIKIGIGPGASCTTRTVTGYGVPQLSAIMDCAQIKNDFPDVTIIADGGIRNSGDIVKALAAGADTVMVGRLLAGADESPFPGLYFGMASKRVNDHHAPEGVEGAVERTGPVADTLKRLAWGIKSGISYSGQEDIAGLQKYSEFIRVSPNTINESGARI